VLMQCAFSASLGALFAAIYFRTGTTAVPTELIIALPYILTIVLTIFRSNFRVPAKLGVPYRKEG
jgi:ABC-type uncharacterized transport system permease subunit